jgi:hypothetical protein
MISSEYMDALSDFLPRRAAVEARQTRSEYARNDVCPWRNEASDSRTLWTRRRVSFRLSLPEP